MEQYTTYIQADPGNLHTADYPAYTIETEDSEKHYLQHALNKNGGILLLFLPMILTGATVVPELPKGLHVELYGNGPVLKPNSSEK
jgi:hypothetical protein